MTRSLRCTAAVLAACAVVMLAAAAALAAAPGHYYGETNFHLPRWMSIDLKVQRGTSRVQWIATVDGPCSKHQYGMGVGFGSADATAEPVIHLRHGRFTITRHGVTQTLTHWSYTFTGRTTRFGFAGTMHYVQSFSDGHQVVRCDSRVIHWQARRVKRAFP